MAAPAPVLCAGGAGVLLGAFQVWGCQWLRGGAVGYEGGGGRMADDRTQKFDPRA